VCTWYSQLCFCLSCPQRPHLYLPLLVFLSPGENASMSRRRVTVVRPW
jgi:hypothetical protein